MPYVIAICHQKGGVGKTTTALALGACFVERGVRTLMVDLDPQANLTFNSGLEPDKVPFSVAEALTGEAAPAQTVMESNLPGLDIIPSNASMLDIGRRVYQMPDYEFLLRRALQERALKDYAVVWLDCPPSVGPLTINALTAADLLIIPTQCEYYSIQALTDLFELVSVIRVRRARKIPCEHAGTTAGIIPGRNIKHRDRIRHEIAGGPGRRAPHHDPRPTKPRREPVSSVGRGVIPLCLKEIASTNGLKRSFQKSNRSLRILHCWTRRRRRCPGLWRKI
jgi:cellulose biosynthesis protein BcsQ